jgi:uncharacterized protein (TIGR02611 family)
MPVERNSVVTALRNAARRVLVAVIGFGIVTFGVALIFLPGPAVLVIPLGLAILATEFIWARKLLRPLQKLFGWLKARAERMLVKPSPPTCL